MEDRLRETQCAFVGDHVRGTSQGWDPGDRQARVRRGRCRRCWLKPREPVIFFVRGSDARAYPLQILIWHEIVNDIVGALPVAITFCPLCNTAIAFDRRVHGQTLSFGTTGKLRFSDLVMYDRQTESWWQQATGQAIVGALTGVQLMPLPAQTIS